MAINLASKFESALQRKFTQDSILIGKLSDKFDFAGVRSITVYGIQTVALGDYSRTATSNRFGTPTELQDTIQEMTLSQDKSFALTIDKGNKQDTMNNKQAGVVLKAQLDEQNIPFIDKYGFGVLFRNAGKSAVISAPTTSTIVGLIADGLTAMDNALVPDDGRFIYIGATMYNKLRLSSEILAVDPMAQQTLGKGVVATFMGYPVVKVPDAYFPTSNYYFIIIRKQSALLPIKFQTLRILTEVPGIDGDLLEGRHFFDCFVLGEQADGIYSAVNTAVKQASVTLAGTAPARTMTSSGATAIKYTLDGSDPRYSKTALTYSAEITMTNGQTLKCVALDTTTPKCMSDVVSYTYTA